jgi:hypothetical protein
MTALAVAVAAFPVATGRRAITRVFALLMGSAVAFFGLSKATAFDVANAPWLSIAFAVTAAFAVVAALRAARRGDLPLVVTAACVLAALGSRWAWVALGQVAAPWTDPTPPVLNLRFLTVIVLLGVLAIARRQLRGPVHGMTRAILGGAGLALAYLGGLVEILALARSWSAGWDAAAVSLWSMAFAAALLWAGFTRRDARLRWAGLIGFAVVAAKIVLFDLGAVQVSLRVLVTGVLGVLLLLGAWAYARRASG